MAIRSNDDIKAEHARFLASADQDGVFDDKEVEAVYEALSWVLGYNDQLADSFLEEA